MGYIKHREVERATRWARENPDRRAASLARHAPKAARQKAAARKANPDAARARDREQQRRRRAADPVGFRLAARERSARRRAREREQFVERLNPAAIFERDKGLCGICKLAVDPADWHLDHVVPIARGGAHSNANVQVSHPTCNRRKWAH